MDEYIERENDVIVKLANLLHVSVCDYDCERCKYGSDDDACICYLELASAKHLAANDVVPVVRCKDCKHGYLVGKKVKSIACPYYDDQTVDPDHFCSYGERKDGE